MGVSRACDEAMAALSSVARAFLDPFLRGVTFWATEGLDELLENKANQQCHFKTYRALDLNVSTGIVMGTVPTHVIFRISENACFGQTNKCVCVTHEYGSKG